MAKMQTPKGYLRRSNRTLVAFMVVSLLLAANAIIQPLAVSAYSCTNPHCYGWVEWDGSTTGAGTQIYIVPISSTINGRITDEQWLIESTTDGRCAPSGSSNGLCWIEAGFSFDQGGGCSYEKYFHAANIPAYGYIELCDWPAVADGDLNHYLPTFIYAGDASHTLFVIQLNTPSGTQEALLSLPVGRIDPNGIQVGEEISGTSGIHGQESFWIQSMWITNTYQGVYQVHPTPYGPPVYLNNTSYPPIYADFFVLPSDRNDGGVWRAIPPS